MYRSYGYGLWVVRLAESGEFVGDCGLTPQVVDGREELEVGYHVMRPLQGRGYATEAAAAARDFARDRLGARRLTAIIHPANLASQRVAEKAGFLREGVLRAWAEQHGRRVDLVMWSLLPGDAMPRPERV